MAAVLLAAGLSRRMGDVNKLLIDIDGKPMVRRAAETLLANNLALYVVTGHERERVEAALRDLDNITFVHNPAYRDGQASSIRAGLAALNGDHEAALIALSDQPGLEAADIADLINAFQHSDGSRILMPVFDGQRGNPIVVPGAIIETIGDGPMNFGCRKFMDANPERVWRYEVQNDHFTRDIDTPLALAALA
jgi:molybdenum cofactor cytidylyltransferase